MSLYRKLLQRQRAATPIRVGMVGAGKFGSMFLAQIRKIPGVQIVGIADLSVERARSNLEFIGWPADALKAGSAEDALKTGGIFLTEDALSLTTSPFIDVMIESTGDPIAAVDHIVSSFDHGKDVVNVTVEADSYCGAGLARRARGAGVLYSLAYGDQPALATELVDWARCCGFHVMAAGRGHKWQPHFRLSTPDTVWDHWGLSAEQAERGRLNPKMFNSFLDGSKPAIESAAIANATGLSVPSGGLAFPAGNVESIPELMRPQAEGGALESRGMVEVISSLREDGSHVGYDIRQGIWVCVEADTDYIRNCFEEYGLVTDSSGRYSAMYKRFHLIGLELGMSVAHVGARREPTGTPTHFIGDVCAVSKGRLRSGTMLDGEGGATVYGGLRPAQHSTAGRYLPLGLSHGAVLKRDIALDEIITLDDVKVDTSPLAFTLRAETEALLES